MEEFTIGQMAKMNCVSEKALRIYQEKGILEPARVDENGYRFYTLEQCPTIDMIQQLQALGCSLQQIKTILEHRDVDYLAGIIDDRERDIDASIARLRMARRVGKTLRSACDVYQHKPIMNELILEELPERRALIFENEDPAWLSVSSGHESIDNWELRLREIKQEMVQRHYPSSLFHNVGCIIPKEYLERGEILFTESFVFVDSEFVEAFHESRRIPGGTYLTMYIDDAVSEADEETEVKGLHRMLEHCSEKGYKIVGDYIGEVLADTPAFLFEGRNMFMKLCIPISN